MGDTALTFLLDKITDLVKYHVNLISGAEGELQKLKGDLTDMKTLLEDASKKNYKEGHFKVWERNLRSVVYEVEDAIDNSITEAAIAKKTGRVRRFFNGKPTTLAKKIKSLREGIVNDVLDTAEVLKARIELVAESDQIDEIKILRNKRPRQDVVVGFEDEIEKLIGFLLEESIGLNAVTIVGMAGLGKTAVARKIYQDAKIKYEFPILIWAVVSKEFNKREVLLTILKKFTNTDTIPDSESVNDLAIKAKDYLERSKFLLFLDDVRTRKVLNEIFDFLPHRNKRSRVLITTRHGIVGWTVHSMREPHQLRFLNEMESWMLLKLEVFNSLADFPPELEKYGKLICVRCGGLPLAIIMMGGILCNKTSTAGGETRMIEEWRLISEHTDIYSKTEDKNNNSIQRMITFSYNILRYDLRYCFLYVGGIFPKDCEISVWELTKLWIAEGFIKQIPYGKTLEATAHDNLKELINRNLVMVDKIKPNGNVKTCRIHDTIREFCLKEARYENQNLFLEVNKGKEDFDYTEKYICRRLSVHSYVKEFFTKSVKETKLSGTRTFLSFTKPINLEQIEIPAFTEVFELIRVFNAKTIHFPTFPSKFTELVHLRYLTLSGEDLKFLPPAITKLWNLQTLIVDTQSSTLEIKANIWVMMHLRHVKTKSPIILTNEELEGDGGGNKLQTLDKLSPHSCTEKVFEKAKNLRTLGVRGDIYKLEDSRCLEKLTLLEKLKLENYVNHESDGEKPLNSLPRGFPENIRFLTLSNTYLNWSHMSTVEKIPYLEVLKLKNNAFRGDCWDCYSRGFHKLEYLYIIGFEDLILWRIKGDGDPFPSIKTVVVKNCEKLEKVPKDLMRKLKKLELHRVTSYAVKFAKEVKEEMEKESGIEGAGFQLILAPGDAQTK